MVDRAVVATVPAAARVVAVATALVDRAAVAATVVAAAVTAVRADIDAHGRFRLRDWPFFIRAAPRPTAGS
ncbi:hypothetical protein, partial [Komagataeibacter sp. FXV3]|uniref:hypothetical protein n=1 Tax=Komagataeibacter sp. FXV3 TaxID=2608998 RepID=UPI00187BAA8D